MRFVSRVAPRLQAGPNCRTPCPLRWRWSFCRTGCPQFDSHCTAFSRSDGTVYEPQSKPGQMKVSKGQSQPEVVAAAILILYMVLGSPFLYQVLIVTHMSNSHVRPTS